MARSGPAPACRIPLEAKAGILVWVADLSARRELLAGPASFMPNQVVMIQEMREKLGKEIEELTYELKVTLPQAIATAVAQGDLRENSEYKAALERQQLVQARLGQLHRRLSELSQLANSEAPVDRVGLGSKVSVLDLDTQETEMYQLVLAEMMDPDAGHISLGSPLGRALKDKRRGDEVRLRLPQGARRLRVLEVVTIHQLR